MKKLTAIILSTTMTIGASSCVFASSEAWKENVGEIMLDTMTVSGEGISVENNVISITAGGDFDVTGTLADGMIYVSTDDRVKLRLSGASITNTTGPAIFFDNVDKGFITITENTENYLTDGAEYTVEEADAVLFSNDDLEIKGDGTLTIDANYKHGIAGDDDVTIENGKIIINSYEHGIKVNDTLSVTGGTFDITSETGKGMKAELEVIIDGGKINIVSEQSEGIESKGTLTVNGGDINITAAEDGLNTGNSSETTTAEGTPTKMPQMGGGRGGRMPGGQRPDNMQPPEGMQMPQMNGERMQPRERNGENMQPPAPDDGTIAFSGGNRGGGMMRVDEETAAAHAITINGGNIYLNISGDGIDSNGNLTINGGKIIIDGPLSSGNGPLDSDGAMVINGGTVITASGAGMIQLPRSNEGQKLLSVMFSERQSAGTVISISDSNGDEIVSHTPAQAFQSFIFSSESIAEAEKYTIYVNGTEYKKITAASGTASIGSAGMDGGMGGRENRRPEGNMMKGGNRNNQIKVQVNGSDVRFDTTPVIKNDTTLVGFRAILEAFGATVNWDEATKTVTAEKDGTTVVMTIGSTRVAVNGKEKTLLLAPEIINNSTMIPVRFVSEQLNMDVQWDDTARMISISSK